MYSISEWYLVVQPLSNTIFHNRRKKKEQLTVQYNAMHT